MKPFEFINSITYNKRDVMDEENERNYAPYLTNRTLSYFIDTVLQANEMNRLHHVDNRLQFDYLINSVRKKKRFSKWIKPSTFESIELIKEYYGYNDKLAKDVVDILSDDQIEEIRKRLNKGGT